MKKIIPVLAIVILSFLVISCPDYLGSDPAGRWNPIDPEYDETTDPDAGTAPDPDDTIPPATVVNFTAAAGVESVALSWSNPADDFAGVLIRFDTTGYPATIAEGTEVYDGTDETYQHTGLTAGTTYYYSAFSYDGAGNYSQAASDSATAASPAQPIVSGLSNDTTPTQSKTWTWDADIAGCTFRHEVTTDASFTFTTEAYTSTTTAAKSDGDGTYYLYVQAKSPEGVEGPVASVSALLDNTAPAAITDFTAVAGVRSVSLSWTNPAEDFAGVEIRYFTDNAGSCPSTPIEGTQVYIGTGATFTHDSLTSGTEYDYSIFVYDEAGNYSGPDSDFVTPESSATDPVTGFSATDSHQSVFLTWTNPGDAGFAGVTIRYRTDATFPTSPTDGSLAYDGTAEEFDHMYLTQGNTYYYSIFAYDTEGYYAAGDTTSGTALAPEGLPGPAARYLFDGSGSDSSGNGNDLTLYPNPFDGPTAVADRLGVEPGAYDFDGSNDFMKVLDTAVLDLAAEYAISIWFKPDDIANTIGQYLVSKGTGTAGVDGAGYDIYVVDNQLRIAINKIGYIQQDISGMNGQWIHVVLNNSAATCKLYIQNIMVNDLGGSLSLNDSPADLNVGYQTGAFGDQYFDGIIDDIRMYAQPLTEAQISTLYHEW